MKKFAALYLDSYRELKHVRTLVLVGMFAAVAIVLGYFTIEAGPYLKIGISSVANEFVYYLFGPVTGGIYGGVVNLVKYFIKPTSAFFPGYTLNAMLAGVLYGSCLYKRPLTFQRVLLTKLLVTVVCNMILTTYMNVILAGDAAIAMIPIRIVKNLIQWPVDSVLFFVLVKKMESMGVVRAVRTKSA